MKSKALVQSILLASGLAFVPGSYAQPASVQFPAPSPQGTVKQRVGLTDIEVIYSRPGMKNRKIFGGLVPYGEVWRTGANQSTRITFSTPVKLNGAEVPAGTYALFTIPGEKQWTVIIHKDTAASTGNYSEANDLVRFKATPVKLSEPVETFTIEVNDLRDDSATIDLVWETTRVPVKVDLDLTSKLVPQIEAAMAGSGEQKPYFQAAMFYYDHGLDLKKAREWIDAAVKQRETFFIVHLQAKILAKQGDKAAALAAAQRSLELSKTAKDASYVRQNEALIASLR